MAFRMARRMAFRMAPGMAGKPDVRLRKSALSGRSLAEVMSDPLTRSPEVKP